MRIAIAIVLILSPVAIASALAQSIDDISISKAWIRATPNGVKSASGFMAITNNGTMDIRLVAVEYSGAKKSQIHLMKLKDGIMTMRAIEKGILIAAGTTVSLKGENTHLMFMGLEQRLDDGETISVQLTFDNSAIMITDFSILSMENARKLMAPGN